MILRCIAESSVEPLTVDEVRAHLRITSTSEDSVLQAFIKTARLVGENKTNRAFVPHTYQLTLDEFPSGGITLPNAPLSSAATDVVIEYTDSSGATQTLSATAYTVDDRTEPGYIAPSSSNEWPTTGGTINSVTITYKAGYPLNSGSPTTPEAIKTWMKMYIGSLYEHRESAVVTTDKAWIIEIPGRFFDGLLDPYCIIEV